MCSMNYYELCSNLHDIEGELSGSSEICNEIIVKGKLNKGKSMNAGQQMRVNHQIALSKFLQSKGYSKKTTGDFISYSKAFSLKPLADFIARQAVVTKKVDFEKPGMTPEQRKELIRDTYSTFNSKREADDMILYALSDDITNKLKKYRNFQHSFKSKYYDQGKLVQFTSESLFFLAKQLIEHYQMYVTKA